MYGEELFFLQVFAKFRKSLLLKDIITCREITKNNHMIQNKVRDKHLRQGYVAETLQLGAFDFTEN